MKTLIKALSLCALLAAQPALAQTIEGDKNVEVSFNVIGGDTQSSFRVLEQPSFGQLVRPRESAQFDDAFCEYTIDNKGETFALGYASNGLVTVSDIQCEFLGSIVAQKLEVECPLGQSVSITGFVDQDGIVARLGSDNFNVVDGFVPDVCESGAFEPNTRISLDVFHDAVLGVRQITIPVDITLSD